MKVLSASPFHDTDAVSENSFELPNGIIGFTDYRRAELLYLPDHLPLLWMRLHGPDPVHFIVIEPGNVIADYEPEIFDEDAASLGITDPADAMVLNIVTLQQQIPMVAHVNLIGPIIVNRRTRQARQVVISNYSRYSAHHPLVENNLVSADTMTA